VELLGACRIVDASTGTEVDMRTRKAKCLLALVLMHPQSSENRERLASLLWDPAPEELARGSLRQALKELRGALGPMGEDLVSADRFTISADPTAFDLDLRRLRALLELGSVAAVSEAAALWKGELFGALLPNAPVFEAWVQVERSHLRNLLTKALTDQLEALMAARDFSDARMAEELVRIEPSHELAHQYLMRYHAMRGDQSAALRQFGALERALEEELDSEPSAATTDLLVAIKRGDIGLDPAPLPTRPDRKGPPRITIRPPLTRAFDSSKDYLGEGFAHLAKTCLSRFRAWVVIPWPATGFEGTVSVDYAALGRAVHADFAIDFVLDWRGPKARLFVTLVDCRDASEVWSRVYEVDEPELQALSSTVAGRVAQNLAAQVNYITLLRQARNSLAHPAAHDLWLRAHQLSRLWNPEADAEAEALLLQAIELDPGLASGHAVLAQILSTRNHVIPGYAGRQADLVRAFKAAQRAVALDPFDPRCHISMAWNWLIQRSPERANSHFRLAVDLNPFDAEILIAAADGMAFLGNMAEALDWAAQALELNPIYPEYYTGYLAGIQFLNGDYSQAVRTVEKCPDAIPYLAVWKAAGMALMGDLAGARAAYDQYGSLIRAIWAGEAPPSDADLQAWIIDTLPIWWPDGKVRLDQALLLARQATLEAAATA
jgi:DNA-binding SARP family transcriptional activator/TolB-like protein